MKFVGEKDKGIAINSNTKQTLGNTGVCILKKLGNASKLGNNPK